MHLRDSNYIFAEINGILDQVAFKTQINLKI